MLLLLGLLAQGAAGQGINDPTNGQPVCPGRTYLYSVTTAASSGGCSYTWTINGGQIVNGVGTALVSVVWNDVPTGPGNPTSLQVQATGCVNSTSSQLYGPKSVFVRSLSQTAIGPVTVSGDVGFGNNATGSVTLSVPQVSVPGPANSPTVLASGYYWTIPQFWQFPNGQPSDGTTAVLINNYSGNSIAVTPTPGTGGTVTVRAADTSCGFNGPTSTVSSQSLAASATVTRPVPTLRIVTDRTPNGGNLTLSCGDQTDYHFRPAYDPLPTGGSFTNYSWSAGGVLQLVSGGNTAAPVLVASGGSGTGTAGLQGTYCRNGACAPAPTMATPVTVSVVAQVAQPTLSGLPQPQPGAVQVLCQPATITASAPGATSYAWTTTGSMRVNGATSATGASVSVGSATGGGSGTVRVQAVNANCAASAITAFKASYGPPQPDSLGYNDLNLCSTGLVYFTARAADPGATFKWSISGNGGRLRFGSTGNQVPVYITDPQGSFDLMVEVRNSCTPAGTAVNVFQVGTFFCEEFDYTCGTSTAQQAAYPNPADESLTIKSSAGATLYNASGAPVATVAARQHQLSTRALPEGTYFLRIGGRAIRHRIQVRHH
ncbi:hypothetical protein B0919_16195 [Hymenobacter sp. CRA2]|nr:hypothetical protein B0919_16195 [Hymenobacter sp. CRA2]